MKNPFNNTPAPVKPRRPARKNFSDDPKVLKGQVTRHLLTKTLGGMEPTEAATYGKRLLGQLIGEGADPKAMIAMEAMETDPEFAARAKELYLLEWEAEMDAKLAGVGRRRRRAGADDDDDGSGRFQDDDPFTMLAKEKMMEQLEGGGGGNTVQALLATLAAFAPVAAQMMGAMTGQVPPQAPSVPGQIVPPGLAAPDGDATPVGPVAQVVPGEVSTAPLLADILSHEDVRGVLALAGQPEQAALKMQEIVNGRLRAAPSDIERFRLHAGSQMFTTLSVEVVVALLGSYEQYPEWSQIRRFISEHPAEFAAVQRAYRELSKPPAATPQPEYEGAEA